MLLIILITVLQTSPLSNLSPDHNTILVSGVASTDRIFKVFVYVELRELAKDQTSAAEARRTALLPIKHIPQIFVLSFFGKVFFF